MLNNSSEVRTKSISEVSAVEANGVRLSYRTNQALKGVDLTVSQGVIFALLGPSGCGKSTLLSAILGLKGLDEGHVRVFGKCPGSKGCGVPGPWVGFMPQDLTLYLDLNVLETLTYFGNLQPVSAKYLKERILFLLDLLNLSSMTYRLVKLLSGGQRRRLSLAVSLILDPALVLLDEPTVGVDPLLRKAIWDHLVELVKNRGRTVIITTHYIEEARKADLVGFMRAGRIIEIGSPEAMIQKAKFSTLEEVFLVKCWQEENRSLETLSGFELEAKQSTSQDFGNKSSSSTVCAVSPTMDESLSTKIKKSLSVIKNVTYKNVLLLRRNYWLLLLVFAMPVGTLTLSTNIIGLPPFDLSLVVVNREQFVGSAGSKYIQTLNNHTLKWIKMTNVQEAIERVRDGKSWAALVVGKEFTNSLLDRVKFGLKAGETDFEDSKLRLYMDWTNLEVGRTIYFSLLESFDMFVQDSLKSFGLDPKIGAHPLQLQSPIYGSMKPTFSEFLTASLVPNSMTFASLSMSSMTFVAEQQFFQRSRVSGLTVGELLLAHVITQSAILVVLSGSLVVFLICFGILAWSQVGVVGLILFWHGLAGMALGVLLSALANNATATLFLTTTFYLSFNSFNGVLWPVQGQPYWIQPFSYCLVETRTVHAMRSIISRGWSLGHRGVWISLVFSLVWTVIPLLLAVVVFRVKQR